MNEAIVEHNAGRELRISREYDAPRELIWKALTDPAHVGVWWGPDGFTTTTKSIDVRPGGSWVYTMHGPDGRDYPNAMTFREIVAPERLVYRHGTAEEENPDGDFGTVVTLENLGHGRTRVTLTSLFKDSAARELVEREYGAVEGGQQHLEKLADHLERMSHAFVITRTFDAPRELVWKAFTEADRMAAWWGPPGTTLRHSSMDLRPGGRYHFHSEFPDGNSVWGLFIYSEIEPMDRIVYLHSFSDKAGNVAESPFGGPWPARIHTSMLFADLGDKTEFTLRQFPLEATAEEEAAFTALLEGMALGWGGTLDQLAAYLSGARA